jgi:tetratricopeptide (TPR) repeat protein
MEANSFQRALEYAIPALDMDPDNQILLGQKGMCLFKLGDLPGATAPFEKAVQLDQSNMVALANLLELYLIKNSIDEFHGLYSKNKALIVSQRSDATSTATYFEVLEQYQLDDVTKMKSLVEGYLKSMTSEKEKRTVWDFSDVKKFLAPKQDEPKGAILNILMSVMNGDMERGEAMSKISDVA